MARPARLAALSILALAVLAASTVHLLARPAVTHAAGRTVVVLDTPAAALDPAEHAVVAHVAQSGLHVVSTSRVYDPISRQPLVVVTNRGVLVVTETPIACGDAPGVAQDIHLVGAGPAAAGHVYVGRIAGLIVLTADAPLWAALDADPC